MRAFRILAAVVAVFALAAASRAGAAPGPPSAPEYWFDTWQVHRLWASGARGQGVTIAEVDSGVNAALPELHGRVLPGTDLGRGGDGRIDRDITPFGHGTAMASIMVARRGTLGITGLAPGARILPIAVPLNGTTDAKQSGKVPAAIRYAVAHHAKIINLSIGGKRVAGQDATACPPPEQRAVFGALRAGAIVIAAVGNTGPTDNTVEEPGSCLGVVAVGAVDAAGRVARFSGRLPYLALVAPGVRVPSLGRVPGQAFSGEGTSQAAALVSASAALVWSAHPGLTGEQVVARLLATLDRRRSRPSPAYGYGLLDTYSAVTARVPGNAPDPVAARARPFVRRAAGLSRGLGPAPPPVHGRLPGAAAVQLRPPTRTSSNAVPGGILAGSGVLALLALAATRRRRRAVSAVVEPPGSPR